MGIEISNGGRLVKKHVSQRSAMDKATAQNNYMYYSNPEVDKMTEIAENTLDEKERLDALGQRHNI